MEFEYIANGKRVRLPVDPGKIAIRFRDPSDQAGRRGVIDPMKEVGTFDERYEIPREKFTVVNVANPDKPGPARFSSAFHALNAKPAVERVAPVFVVGNKQAVATDRVIVGFKPETGEKGKEIIAKLGGEIISLRGEEYLVRLKPDADPFTVIADMIKRTEVDYAEPDFVTIGEHTPRQMQKAPKPAPEPTADQKVRETSAPDPFQPLQYALTLTQAIDSLKLVAPSPNIKIAVLDEGVDRDHPDLRDAIVATYDTVDHDLDQQPNHWDAHGTACAGLAAGIPNNAIGVRGVAGGCSIMAVRIASSPFQGANWSTSNSQIAEGIDWAWENGADILSNSWGGGVESTAITNAFERARTQGRNGKGCVVLVAAGNEPGPVEFPANLVNVLTVSASNEYDEPKTTSSADGEDWWGSSFGPEVDVAAPGVHNYTTDISGSAGYNSGGTLDPDYVSDFNGTSSATPIVAGVAALILSANQNLREAQVRSIIKETADKVGRVVYRNGHNNQMGHGRVNALNAVRLALSGLLPGPSATIVPSKAR